MSGSKQSVKVTFPPLLQGRAYGPQCLGGLVCNVMYPCMNRALGFCRLVLRSAMIYREAQRGHLGSSCLGLHCLGLPSVIMLPGRQNQPSPGLCCASWD